MRLSEAVIIFTAAIRQDMFELNCVDDGPRRLSVIENFEIVDILTEQTESTPSAGLDSNSRRPYKSTGVVNISLRKIDYPDTIPRYSDFSDHWRA